MNICVCSYLNTKVEATTFPARSSRPSQADGEEQCAQTVVSESRGIATSRRAAFTLIEMLVVMTIFVMLLATVSLAIGSLFKAQGNLQSELIEANAMSRIGEQLRADAHVARSAAIVQREDVTTLQLSASDSSIVSYELRPRRVVRTKTDNGAMIHRDVFDFSEGTTFDLTLTDDAPRFVTLTTKFVAPELTSEVARPRVHKIQASIGLHVGGER